MKRLVSAVLFVCLIAFALSTYAATIRIPVTQPTIQAGIDSAVNGDTVLVADGIYTGDGNKHLDFKGKAIIVTSENGTKNCIIDCEGLDRAFYFHSGEGLDSVVSGFTMINGSVGYGWWVERKMFGGAIYCRDYSSPTIENNAFVANFADSWGGAITCYLNSSPVIQSNLFYRNRTGDWGGAICCFKSSSPTIQNNVIVENECRQGGGIFCDTSSSPTIQNNQITSNVASHNGGGIYCARGSYPAVVNNTISDNSAGEQGGGIYCATVSAITGANNIIWANSSDDIYVDFTAWIDITYSNIKGGWPGEGNINADPLFVDAPDGNYNLRVNSPCIGTGFEEADMGVYEHLYETGATNVSVKHRLITTWGAIKR